MAQPVTPADLRELVDSVSVQVETLPEPGAGNPGHDLVIVAKSLMWGIIGQAKAVVAVSQAGLGWAAGSNLRTMFEGHLDVRWMLAGSTPERNARRIAMYAMRDMAASSTADSPDSPLRLAIASFANLDPEAHREYEEAWRSNKFHWSGRTRSNVMDELERLEPTPESLRMFYKWYSWPAHLVIEPVLDYDWSEGGSRRRQARFYEGAGDQGACMRAAQLLRDTWERLQQKLTQQ
jgi:hypothetical protein